MSLDNRMLCWKYNRDHKKPVSFARAHFISREYDEEISGCKYPIYETVCGFEMKTLYRREVVAMKGSMSEAFRNRLKICEYCAKGVEGRFANQK